jgi:hypothetical protein
MFSIKYLLFSLAFLPVVSMSADKHVHGEAQLFIAIDGNQVLLELESPADNIIGFEHAPATERQQKQLESGLVKLDSYLSIATFPEVNCQQISAEVKSPFKDHHEAEAHEDGHDSNHKEHNHEEHSHKEHGMKKTMRNLVILSFMQATHYNVVMLKKIFAQSKSMLSSTLLALTTLR